jgi:uncharacterized membrane protein YedE/YeeE
LNHFTPYSALAGGTLIGLSAALLYIFNGRIAGISSIFGNFLLPKNKTGWLSSLVFLTGLIIGGLLYQLLGGNVAAFKPVSENTGLIIAGLLVGIGTTLGSGCTSGHGICGISRLSPRSLLATGLFMFSAMVTVALLHH